MDNKQIKDGVGNLFTSRMRDISPGADGSLVRSMIYATAYPVDYGAGGSFQYCAKTGAMAAGLAASAPVFAFQWPSGLFALIRRVRLSAWSLGTPFTAGLATFDAYIARGFTTQYAGGNAADLTGNHAKLRTSMAPSQASIVFGALTGATVTLDPAPLDSRTFVAPTTANTIFAQQMALFEKLQGEHPLFLVTGEGLVICATVPATGVWQFEATVEWDEVAVY